MSERIERHGGRQHGAVPGRGKPAPQYLHAAQGCAILASLGVGFASFWGLRDFFQGHEGLIGWLLPLSISIVVTSMLCFLWHYLIELAAHA